jgi:hypothetical protein
MGSGPGAAAAAAGSGESGIGSCFFYNEISCVVDLYTLTMFDHSFSRQETPRGSFRLAFNSLNVCLHKEKYNVY